MNEAVRAISSARSLCTFRADRRLYGIEVSLLREISTNLTITPVPPAPPSVRGLANLRNRVLLVLDVRALLGLSVADCAPEGRLIVLKPTVAEDIALLVDEGGDIVTVPEDQIEPVEGRSSSAGPSAEQEQHHLVCAVCKLENELLMVVDPTRLADAVSRLMTEEDVNHTIGEVRR